MLEVSLRGSHPNSPLEQGNVAELCSNCGENVTISGSFCDFNSVTRICPHTNESLFRLSLHPQGIKHASLPFSVLSRAYSLRGYCSYHNLVYGLEHGYCFLYSRQAKAPKDYSLGA